MTLDQLYDQLSNGITSAENELFSKLTARFRYVAQQRIGNSLDAEEIVQDSLVVVAKKFRTIEFERSFAAWAFKVLHLRILEFYRKKKVRDSVMLPMPSEELLASADNPDPKLRLRLKECIRKLCQKSIRHARMLALVYQGYSMDEICERMIITRTNAYSILSRSRSILKDCLRNGELK